MSGPIVVLGAPRSGTTYLIKLLNSHPQVDVSNETRLLVFLHDALALTQLDRACFRHREEFTKFIRPVLAGAIETFQQRLAGEASHWGDKNPHYAHPANRPVLELAADLFPEARFIHIVRDGRAVVTSLMRKGWESFESAHVVWPEYVRSASDFGRTVGEERFLEVKHEDFIDDDLVGARRVFGFLGLAPTAEVEEFCARQGDDRVPINNPTSSLGQPATADWERLLAEPLRSRSSALLASTLEHYGYEVTGEARDAGGAEGWHANTRPLTGDAPVLVAGGVSDPFLLNLGGHHRIWHLPSRGDNVFDREAIQSIDSVLQALDTAIGRGARWLMIPTDPAVTSVDVSEILAHAEAQFRSAVKEPGYTIFAL